MPLVRDPLDPRDSMYHFLAFYLRWWREKEGLSLTQCGQIIGAARSTVSNLEAGRQRPHDDWMRMLDLKYGTGLLFQLLLWYARMAHDPDWARQVMGYEKQSTSMKIYHGQVIPRPFQTEDYIRGLVQASWPTEDPEAKITRRMHRQNVILERENPPLLWLLIDESVLARPVGGTEVMRAQLEHLRKMACLPHVIMRIVPTSAGPHWGLDGPFQVVSLEGRDVAFAGAQNGGRLIEAPGETRHFSTMFDRIGAKALPEDASVGLVDQYLENYT
ncbi:helix-turn-helix transcriptional regulator [Actinomadura sp. 9N407]|uniref:helix-turn-helix transcriptional regulator n=1 Tax=Actinomadura sp. 9N407 TaxID=3375154 RepID=UPI00378F1054